MNLQPYRRKAGGWTTSPSKPEMPCMPQSPNLEILFTLQMIEKSRWNERVEYSGP